MRKSWLMCVLLGTLAWGQAAPSAPAPPQPAQTPGNLMARPQTAPEAPDTSASVPDDAAVITVIGVCPEQSQVPMASTPAADCKTVITKAQFEKLAKALMGNVTPQGKKQLSTALPRSIGMASEARKKGLDKTEDFNLTVEFARLQILTNQLQRHIQEDAGNIPQEELAKYYKDHADTFEQFNVDRMFVPRTKQGDAAVKPQGDKDEKLSDEAKKAKEVEEKMKEDAAEQSMTKLAESLRARAAAGEDILKLQKEAFAAAGMKIESPTVNLPTVRRAGLPPGHAAVFDLKAGEVSQVISDGGGHYIYKVNSRTEIPLDQAEKEIRGKLQADRNREMTERVNNSFKVETNELYFPAGAGGGPPPRVPRPGMAPGGGPAQPPTPPPAQAPAAKPN